MVQKTIIQVIIILVTITLATTTIMVGKLVNIHFLTTNSIEVTNTEQSCSVVINLYFKVSLSSCFKEPQQYWINQASTIITKDISFC